MLKPSLVGLPECFDDPNVIAQCVTDEGLALRDRAGSYRRRRIGWIADLQGVTLVVHAQPLKRRADGRLLIAGDYAPESNTRYQSDDIPSRRIGEVSADLSISQDQATPGHPVESIDHPEARLPTFRGAHEALAVLPAPVRRSVLNRVPQPLFFTGQLASWSDGDNFSVDLLRLDRTAAIAVHARTHRDTTTWHVDQVVYEFPAHERLTGTGEHGEIHP